VHLVPAMAKTPFRIRHFCSKITSVTKNILTAESSNEHIGNQYAQIGTYETFRLFALTALKCYMSINKEWRH
jgi:hypothetical protein